MLIVEKQKVKPNHPGGELALLTFAGKDATEEFDMIHPPDVVEKYAPDSVIGELKQRVKFTMEEVAKHNAKEDCWLVLHNRVLNVTSWLPHHPGGELALTTFAGKDVTAEFDMIHPSGTVEKYAPDSVVGELE